MATAPKPPTIQPDPALAATLNPLLATEWGLIRALRALGAEATEDGLRQCLKRLRTDSIAHAANLARLIRELDGHPTDVPSQLGEEVKKLGSFNEKISSFQAAHAAQKIALNAVAEKISQPAAREALEIMALLHGENVLWLNTILAK